MTNHNKNYFKTSDLSLCAALCYFGYTVEAIDKTNHSKVDFIIKRDKKLDDTIKAFWAHELKVEPMAFFNFVKELKNRIYSN